MEIRSRILLVALLLLVSPSIFSFLAFAQTPSGPGSSSSNVKTVIEPTWSDGGGVRIKVSFLTPSGAVQPHIDYNVIVTSKDGTVMFDAAKKTSQTSLHTAEGVVTIPQVPDSPLALPNGNYNINATIYGVLFQPVTPSTTTMPVTVIPEFPMQLVVATAGFVAAAVVVSRMILGRRPPSLA